MPKSVVTAIVAAILLGISDLASGLYLAQLEKTSPWQSVVATTVLAVVIFGLVKGHRLAWQWGRIVGGLNVLRTILVVGAMLGAGQSKLILIPAIPIAIASAVMTSALGERTARNYFRLTCPECRTEEARAADFFFRRAKCGRCSATW